MRTQNKILVILRTRTHEKNNRVKAMRTDKWTKQNTGNIEAVKNKQKGN